jgi:hypothetical protein
MSGSVAILESQGAYARLINHQWSQQCRPVFFDRDENLFGRLGEFHSQVLRKSSG